MSENVFLTGANGFIGRYLLPKLADASYRVTAIYNRREPEPELLPLAKWLKLNISDYKSYEALFERKFSTIVHLAGVILPQGTLEKLEAAHRVNYRGVKNLLELANNTGVQKFINASTISVYAFQPDEPITEESEILANDSYSFSKYKAEQLIHEVCEKNGIQAISLRCGPIFGLGQNERFMFGLFCKLAQERKEITVYGRGKERRDYIYVKDVAEAFMKALESNHSGIYNIGAGQTYSIAEIAQAIQRNIGSKSKQVKFLKDKPEKTSSYQLDCARAKEILGFTPKFNLEEGLKDMKEIQKSSEG